MHMHMDHMAICPPNKSMQVASEFSKCGINHHSSSRLARWKHMTVQTNMTNDVNSIHIAPVSIIWACLRIMGMAILPTADAPVRNLAASIQLQHEILQQMNKMLERWSHNKSKENVDVTS